MTSSKKYSSFSREIELPGYVLDQVNLRGIDQYARTIFGTVQEQKLDVAINAMTQSNVTLPFKSIDELVDYLQKKKDLITDLVLDYRQRDEGRIRVFFNANGSIRFTAFAPAQSIEFIAEGLIREVQKCSKNYHWVVKSLAFTTNPRWFLSVLFVFLSFCLVVLIAYFSYASQVGVDIDEKLLHQGNTYYQAVEKAIASKSLDEKMDVLLKGQLNGFMNVSAVLTQTKVQMGIVAVALIGIAILLFAVKSFAAAYPRAFFSWGSAEQELARLERRRELWIVGVGLAFIINVGSGILLAFFV